MLQIAGRGYCSTCCCHAEFDHWQIWNPSCWKSNSELLFSNTTTCINILVLCLWLNYNWHSAGWLFIFRLWSHRMLEDAKHSSKCCTALRKGTCLQRSIDRTREGFGRWLHKRFVCWSASWSHPINRWLRTSCYPSVVAGDLGSQSVTHRPLLVATTAKDWFKHRRVSSHIPRAQTLRTSRLETDQSHFD